MAQMERMENMENLAHQALKDILVSLAKLALGSLANLVFLFLDPLAFLDWTDLESPEKTVYLAWLEPLDETGSLELECQARMVHLAHLVSLDPLVSESTDHLVLQALQESLDPLVHPVHLEVFTVGVTIKDTPLLRQTRDTTRRQL